MLHVIRHLFHEFSFVYLFLLPNADVIVTLLQYFVCYGRTLSDASMLYFADVFLIFFYGRLSWPNG